VLTFEEKLEIIESYPELQKKEVSLGRVNFHFEASVYEKKIVVQHLHPNGNGFVYAGQLSKKATDKKGFINIRDYSEKDLRSLLRESITYLSTLPASKVEDTIDKEIEGTWIGPDHHELTVVNEDLLWNIYAGVNLEECFESPVEAKNYLTEEGFRKKEKRK
jgi:hypothetical protein